MSVGPTTEYKMQVLKKEKRENKKKNNFIIIDEQLYRKKSYVKKFPSHNYIGINIGVDIENLLN